MTDEENEIQTIVLTGGPGGGKSTFIRELRYNPEWAGRFVALTEMVAIAGATGITSNEKRFIYKGVSYEKISRYPLVCTCSLPFLSLLGIRRCDVW